jgi:hypothetical protein
MKEAGEQLALGQIAGRAEQDEHPPGRALQRAHRLIRVAMSGTLSHGEPRVAGG